MTRSRSARALTASALALATCPRRGPRRREAEARAGRAGAAAEAKLLEGLLLALDRPLSAAAASRRSPAVAGQPQVYYFGATGGGVWKTTNGGIELDQRLRRLARTGSVGAIAVAPSDPERRLRRHGRELHPRQRLARRRRLQSTDARQDLDARRACATRGRSAASASTRSDPDLVYVAALGHTFGPERRARRLPLEGRRQDAGRRCCSSTTSTGAVDLRDGSREPARPLRRDSGRCSARPGASRAAAPGSGALQVDRRRRHLEEARRQGPAEGPLGQHRRQRLAGAARARLRDDRGRGRRRLPLRRRGRHLAADERRPQPAPARLVLHPRLRRPEGRRHGLRAQRRSSSARWTAARRFADDRACRTATTTTCGSTRGPAADDRGQRRRRHRQLRRRRSWSTHRQPADRAVLPRRSPTTSSRTTSTARSRTTRRSRSRAAPTASASARATGTTVGGGESGYIAPKPGDPDVVYAGCYGGFIDAATTTAPARSATITVWPDNPMGWGAEGMKYRFQWTFPIVVSPHDPGRALRRRRTCSSARTNEGQSWEAISPTSRATTRRSSGPRAGRSPRTTPASSTTARSSRSPSRRATRACSGRAPTTASCTCPATAARRWTNVTPTGLPEWTRDQPDRRLAARRRAPPTLAANRYKLDDYRPYAYVTHRLRRRPGARSPAGLPADALRARGARGPGAPRPALRRHRDGRLRLASTDGARVAAAAAQPARSCRSHDLVVKDDDLVVATQGRSFWILDDIAALRQAKPELASAGGPPLRALARLSLRRARGTRRRRQEPALRRAHLLPAEGGAEGGRGGHARVPRREGHARPRVLARRRRRRTTTPASAEREAFFGPPAPEDDPGQGRPQPLRLGPALPGGLEVQGPDPVGRRDRGPARGAGPLPGAPHGGGPDAEPGVRGAQGPAARDERRRLREAAGAAAEDPRQAHGDPRRDHAAARRARPGEDGGERAKGSDAEKAIQDAARRALEEAHRGRGGALPDEEPAQPGPAQLPDPAQQQARGARRHGRRAPTRRPTAQSYAVYDELAAKIDAELATLDRVLADDVPAFNRLVREKEIPAVRIAKP